MRSRSEQALAFAEVVERGSFTRAAERLRISKAQLSKQIRALESALGAQLLLRTTRRLSLTESGKLYFEYCRTLRETLQEAERAVSAVSSEVRGTVRLTAPNSLGECFLIDMLLGFQSAYPQVEVELDLSIVRRDLQTDGFDLAIRSTRTLEDHLIARPLGVVRELALASPALLQELGQISEPKQLGALPTVSNSSFRDDPHWLFERAGASETVSVRSQLRVNSYSAIRRAALASAGVVRLPQFMVQNELSVGSLVRVCEGWELVATPLWLVYPARRHQPLRTRVLIDFLLQWFDAPERRGMFV